MTDSRSQFERSYIFHPHATTILNQWRHLNDLGRGKNRGALLHGRPGTGKSELAQHFLKSLPASISQERDELPYLYYELSSNIRPNQILRALQKMLGCSFEGEQDYDKRLDSVVAMIHSRNIKWVVFDEFQRLLSQSTKTFHRPVVDFINSFIDRIQRPVLLISEPEGLKILDKNEQTQGRFPRVSSLECMHIDDEKQWNYYVLFIEALHKTIPWQTIPLYETTMAYRLFAATEGNNRFLKSLILDASTYVDIARETVSREHYAKAFANLGGQQTRVTWNPFEKDIRAVKKYLGVDVK